MKQINIAIDGPSAAGKSTIAKALAKQLGYAHLDTGAMYRCVGYFAKEKNVNMEDEEALATMMKDMEISFDEHGTVFINGEDVAKEIRANDVSMLASKVSAFSKVRETLVALQQQIAKQKGYILDGRDIGTVVLPDAELKIYMVASVDARAKRRYEEYISKGIKADYKEIASDIEQRDFQDMNRSISPLKQAEDAILVDTSDMSIEEVVAYVKNLVEEKRKKVGE